ncbi:hypothetical protein [Massilia sp. CFBP9026]|uniref:hypothetical protein n=1 Tax=Massilia sp. CFBP9026 TaxID=3096536 RepID=UPI002A6A3A13|nr:hypothetical protein [Massilia sp. CFBP9026]MDY0961349.1 hypothetical protein [Massilia sp. CFBP9026]
MRKNAIATASAAAVVALLGAAPPAFAAPVLQEMQVPVAGISCSRIGPPPQRVTPDAEVLESIDGVYRLSNGQKLGIAAGDQQVVADFGRWHQIPLVATTPERFESRDGLVWVRYEADEATERIVVSYPADARGHYVDAC